MSAAIFVDLLFLIGVALGIVIGITLIIKSIRGQFEHLWPGLFNLIAAIELILYACWNHDYGITPGWLTFCLYLSFGLSLSPLLYMYVRELTGSKMSLKGKILHFLSPMISFLVLASGRYWFPESIVSIIQSGPIMAPYPAEVIKAPKWIMLIFNDIAFPFQLTCYSITLLLIIQSHQKRLVNFYSNVKGLTLTWIKALIIGYSLYVLVLYSIEYLIRDLPDEAYNLLFTLEAILLMAIIGFFGFKQRKIFNETMFKEVQQEIDCQTDTEKRVITLNKQQAELLKERLNHVMETGVYLHPDFNIQLLAQLMSTNRSYVSWLFKEFIGENFYSFMNRHRIKKATELLQHDDKRKYTIQGISEMVGYKSRSTFIKHFREQTGINPGNYRFETEEIS